MTIEDLSGTHRKSALQLDVEVLERRVVELERRLSEMAIEVVALTEENRAIKQAGTRLSNRIIDVLDNIIDESALLDALEKWDIAKEEKQ
jgi:regulator of replication initiation timing